MPFEADCVAMRSRAVIKIKIKIISQSVSLIIQNMFYVYLLRSLKYPNQGCQSHFSGENNHIVRQEAQAAATHNWMRLLHIRMAERAPERRRWGSTALYKTEWQASDLCGRAEVNPPGICRRENKQKGDTQAVQA